MKRCYSLKRNKEFRYVYRRGNSKAHPLLVLIWVKARGNQGVHAGFSVSKKIGNSVVRNRVKRRLREALTPWLPRIKDGYNLIFIAREAVVKAEFTAVSDAVHNLLRRADVLKKD